MPTEADTCRKFVVPKLQDAGWDSEPHSIAEQRTITDGRVVPVGKGFIRKPPKRVDYLLRSNRNVAMTAEYRERYDFFLSRRGSVAEIAREVADVLPVLVTALFCVTCGVTLMARRLATCSRSGGISWNTMTTSDLDFFENHGGMPTCMVRSSWIRLKARTLMCFF
jgi:hypothetical protein